MKALNDGEFKERLEEGYTGSRALCGDERIITQGDLTVAVLEVLDRELTPNLPIAVMFELNVETREPGKCFVDVGLVPQVPKSRWKRLWQRIGLWFLRRAEEWKKPEFRYDPLAVDDGMSPPYPSKHGRGGSLYDR